MGEQGFDGAATLAASSDLFRQDGRLFFDGSIIADRYTVERFLAEGGMGSVYIAVQAPLGRRVALKVLHPRMLHDETAAKRFLREAMASSRLSHPNTIRVFDYGQVDDHLYMAMELLEGESLRERLESTGSVPIEQACTVACQVARSLAEAHELGVVHRDIKPDNIFLAEVEQTLVKVLDFGIASLLASEHGELDKLTAVGAFCGTPEYSSPEQGKAEELDGRSDLYSLGVVLYEMLSGKRPFGGAAPFTVLMAHISDPPPPLPSTIPPALAAFVCDRALAKERADRPSNAAAFIEELTAAADMDGINLRSVDLAVVEDDSPRSVRSDNRALAAHTLASNPALGAPQSTVGSKVLIALGVVLFAALVVIVALLLN